MSTQKISTALCGIIQVIFYCVVSSMLPKHFHFEVKAAKIQNTGYKAPCSVLAKHMHQMFLSVKNSKISVWKFLAHDMIKNTWIIPHEAVECFGWMFLDNADALLIFSPQAASKREHELLKSPIYFEGMPEEGKKKFNTSKSN